MRVTASRYLGIILAIVFALSFIALAGKTSAQVGCLSGMHPAAANEIPGVPAGTCTPNSGTNLTYGGCSFNPYPILEQYKSGSNVLLTPSAGSGGSGLQDGINPVLACRLVQFLQYAQTQGYTLKIVSGYRSAQTQANTCQSICGNANGCTASQGGNCGAPGNSCHQYGLAVDLANGSSGSLSWAQQFLGLGHPSSGAQQFKLFFPITSDGGHLQCIEDMVGACSASTQPCDGSVSITPNLSYTANANTSPSSPISNFINSLFGGNQQQQQPAAQPAPALTAAQPIQQTQQLQPSVSAAPITTSPASVLTTPAASTLSGSPILSSAQQLITPNTTSATSALEILESIANPIVATSSATAIGTTTAIGLNGEDEIAQIAGTEPQSEATSSIADSQIADDQAQSTFTSDNLDQDNSYSNIPASTLQSILQQLKVVLAQIVVFLQPFGGQVPSQNLSE